MIFTVNSYNKENCSNKKTGQRKLALTVKDILELPCGQKMTMIAGRVLRSFYLLKGFHSKGLMIRYHDSLFLITTSAIEGKTFPSFAKAGLYRVLLPAMEHEDAKAFAGDILGRLEDKPDLLETARAYAAAGGDIVRTADMLSCHQNTIRYRLGRIRALTGMLEETDCELYLQLKSARILCQAMESSLPVK